MACCDGAVQATAMVQGGSLPSLPPLEMGSCPAEPLVAGPQISLELNFEPPNFHSSFALTCCGALGWSPPLSVSFWTL